MTNPKPPSGKSAASSDAEKASASNDVALVHRVTPDGAVHVIRRRGDTLEAGALRPVVEGAPINGEVVALRPREDLPLLCDVDVLYAPPAPAKAPEAPPPSAPRRKGPAQVATDRYRNNWDSIWSSKKTDALN